MMPMTEALRVGAEDPIRLHMPDGSDFLAGLVPVEGEHKSVWAWTEIEEGTAPEDWTDGVCWQVNEDGKQSTQPIGWSQKEKSDD